jgi:hypothetical protein
MANAQVTIRGRFPAGASVGLYDRVGDFFTPAGLGNAVKTAKVSDQGEATFKGLDEGGRYWVAAHVGGQWRHAAVTAKAPPSRRRAAQRPTGPQAAQTRAQAQAGREIITGPRNTRNTRVRGVHQGPAQSFAHPQVGKPTPQGKREAEPAPAPRIEDVAKGTPLASDTATGEAVIVDPKAPLPGTKQEDVPKRTQQESDTPHGTATILPEKPVETQEEAGRRKQRSSTPTGSAELTEKEKAVRKEKRSRARKASTKGSKQPGRERRARKPATKKGKK